MKLSELLQVTRKSRKLTLMQLVDKTGISYSMLYRILNDQLKKPRPDILKKLAEPLRLDYNYLLQKAGYINKESSDESDALHAIPVLSWEYCKHLFPFREPINAGLSDQQYHIATQPNNTFALQIDAGHHHYPKFQEGDLIVCQPQEKYDDLDTVLYWDTDEKDIYFATINTYKNKQYMDDLDPKKGQSSILLDADIQDRVIAKVTQHQLKNTTC